jgi:hypothetical protein
VVREPKVSIDFFLDGRVYAHRYWLHVPRVGDEVNLRDAEADAQMTCRVLRVVWGVEGRDSPVQAANIELERADKPKRKS